MIRLRAELREGIVYCLEADGHAGFAQSGQDIVCSAFALLLRSVARSLQTLPDIQLEGGADQKGRFRFNLLHLPDTVRVQALGITRVLLCGLEGLQQDYPQCFDVTIIEAGIRTESRHGTDDIERRR